MNYVLPIDAASGFTLDPKQARGNRGYHKRQIHPSDCAQFCRRAFGLLNSQPLLEFLEGLSGIEAILPAPFFVGGGFHEIGRGESSALTLTL